MKSVKFLEQLQARDNLNDTDLAKKLGISQPSISNLKAGRRVMDDETCLSLALELGINPMEIIGAACIDRAEKSGQKSLWEVFIQRTQTVKTASVSAALALVFVTNLLTPTEAKAAPAIEVSQQQFILCQIGCANSSINCYRNLPPYFGRQNGHSFPSLQ